SGPWNPVVDAAALGVLPALLPATFCACQPATASTSKNRVATARTNGIGRTRRATFWRSSITIASSGVVPAGWPVDDPRLGLERPAEQRAKDPPGTHLRYPFSELNTGYS